MLINKRLRLLGMAALLLCSVSALSASRPNFLIIVADDLGYSDLGAFGGEIHTPNLDALARNGLRLTDFHTAPTCSPTRAMLLTGADHHEVGMGTMLETTTPALRAQGYEGELNEKAATVAELLRDAGYFTVMSGKWHLGLEEARSPKARGFMRSFALMQGGANHFGADQAGQPFDFIGGKTTYRQDGKLTQFPVGQYSTDVYTEHMLDYLREARRQQQPFFAYLAYTAPHWPLQAPQHMLNKYRGRYDAGPEALREQRLARMQALGLVAANVVPHPLQGVPAWQSLSAQERAEQSRMMEIYAAMVDYMDQRIGKVITELKKNGQYRDTVIIFMSDNGAEGATTDERLMRIANSVSGQARGQAYDNSLDNLGKISSFAAYGPAWAQAATAPSQLFKGFTTEGGIHTPAIVTGSLIKRTMQGGRSHALTYVADITPTILQMAGVAHPDTYQGRAVLPMRGASLDNLLRGSSTVVTRTSKYVGWEFWFGRALRRDNWKALYLRPAPARASSAAGHWQLFDLDTDPGETTDLSNREPQILTELINAWNDYAQQVGVVVESPR